MSVSERPKTTAPPTAPPNAGSGLSEDRRRQLDELARRESDSLPVARGARGEAAPVHPDDDHETVFSIFGGASRKGNWEPPSRLSVFCLFGGAELDFREADMLEGVTEVQIFCLFGGAGIKVPPDIDVETRGQGIFGGFSHHAQRADEDDAPRLRITGLALFGGVEVKQKPLRRRWLSRRPR